MDGELKQELLGEIRDLLRKRAVDRLHAPPSGNSEESEGGEGPGVPVEGEEDSDVSVSQEPTEEEELDAEKGEALCPHCGEDTGGGTFCKSCGQRAGRGIRLTKSARYSSEE